MSFASNKFARTLKVIKNTVFNPLEGAGGRPIQMEYEILYHGKIFLNELSGGVMDSVCQT